MTGTLEREPFRALGTLCVAAATTGRGHGALSRRALDAARVEVAACQRALSRFDPASDLSRLNAAAGSWVTVDVRLVEALAAAVAARSDTGGRYDPTILPALIAAGYDRSFEQLVERPAALPAGWHAGAEIDIDPDTSQARVERGAAVDLGGIGKGFAATRALAAMRDAWPALPGALVDLGGDIAVWGTPPEGGPWRVEISDPRTPEAVAGTLELTGGGVATSGRDTRRFGPGGVLHHLIDPATGAPAADGPLAVTVVAATATEAEAHATALAIGAIAEAHGYLATRPGIAALLIPHDGEPVAIGRLPVCRERERAALVITTPGGRFAWH